MIYATTNDMSIRALAPIFAAYLGIISPAFGEDLDRIFQNLPPAKSLLYDTKSFLTALPSDAKPIEVEGKSFRSAFLCELAEPRKNVWEASIHWLIPEGFKQGDVILLVFWARQISPVLEGANQQVEIVVETARSPRVRTFSIRNPLTNDWKRYYLPFVSKADYEANATVCGFRFGDIAIKWEIADLTILNYRASVNVKELPNTSRPR